MIPTVEEGRVGENPSNDVLLEPPVFHGSIE